MHLICYFRWQSYLSGCHVRPFCRPFSPALPIKNDFDDSLNAWLLLFFCKIIFYMLGKYFALRKAFRWTWNHHRVCFAWGIADRVNVHILDRQCARIEWLLRAVWFFFQQFSTSVLVEWSTLIGQLNSLHCRLLISIALVILCSVNFRQTFIQLKRCILIDAALTETARNQIKSTYDLRQSKWQLSFCGYG